MSQWDKPFTPYQWKNFENNKQGQVSKIKDVQPPKANQSPRIQEPLNKNGGPNTY